jgi:hypothetical protein
VGRLTLTILALGRLNPAACKTRPGFFTTLWGVVASLRPLRLRRGGCRYHPDGDRDCEHKILGIPAATCDQVKTFHNIWILTEALQVLEYDTRVYAFL